MIILDTDILTLIEWQDRAGTQVLRGKFAEYQPGEIRASIISVDEQFRGWMSYIAKAANLAKEIEACYRLHRQIKLYAGLAIMDFDELAATHYQRLRKQFRRVKRNDLKIAAIAIANHAEDWTKE